MIWMSVRCRRRQSSPFHIADIFETWISPEPMHDKPKTSRGKNLIIVQFYKFYKVSIQSNNWNNLFLYSLNIWSTGDSSPEPESADNTEPETGSREHMECTQTKSVSEMKVAVSCDTVETDSEDLSENWIEAMLSGRTEKLFSLKFLLPLFF